MAISPCPGAWFMGLAMVLGTAAAAYPEVNATQCGCYQTNGSNSAYFTNHDFYDFRNMSAYVNVPDLIEDATESSQAGVASVWFNYTEWSNSWTAQHWNNAASVADGDAYTLMVYSPNNVYFEANTDANAASSTYLTLRTARLSSFQSAAEIDSVSTAFQYVSARMYARTVGPAGAITAMFTYRDNDNASLVQESDMEVRTKDPANKIQYTNQPSDVGSGNVDDTATNNATVPVVWDDWAVHRMDWISSSTMWYVNGQNVSQISTNTPQDPAQILFNAWSNGAAWSGNMSVGDVTYMQIQWIELLYNSSGNGTTLDRRDGSACVNVCSLDETQQVGTPVLLPSAAAFRSLGKWCFWTPMLAMVALWII